MTKHMKAALFGASGVVVAVGAAVFSGALDGILQRTVSPPAVETPVDPKVTAIPSAPGEPAADEVVVPVFDIVRVEPTGDAVIAGQGIPDGEVEILSGETVIARGKISPTGEWAIVLSDPLKAGVHDLTIRTRGADGAELVSQQSVAVEVPAGGQGEVLVVVNRPGAPSEVLQVPAAEAVEDAVALANAPQAPAAAAPEPAAEPAPQPAVVAEATPPPAPADSPPVASAEATPPVEAEPAPAPQAVADVEPAAAPDAPSSPTEPAPAPAATAVAPSEPAPAATPPVAAAEPAPSEPQTGGETVVVGGEPVEPAAPAEAAAPIVAVAPPPPADVASSTPAEVAPEPAPPATGEGVAPPATGEAVAAAAAVEPAAPASDTAAPAAVEPAPVVSVEAVELENGERFFAAGAANPGALLRVYVDDVLAGEIRAMDTGRWLLDTTLPLEPGPHSVRVDHVQPDGTVVARAGVPFDIAAAEIAAVTVEGSGQGSATAGTGLAGEARVGESKTMIIRRGDNLWRIARRLYGQGVRYSTIYAANTDQIGDPDMIYPGQVFVIPEGDRNWQPAEAPAAATPPTAVN